MASRVQFMWALDVFSEGKLYMVMNHQKVLSARRWLAVTAAHVLDAERRSIPSIVQMERMQTSEVSEILLI